MRLGSLDSSQIVLPADWADSCISEGCYDRLPHVVCVTTPSAYQGYIDIHRCIERPVLMVGYMIQCSCITH